MPASRRSSVMCSLQASVASSTALANSVESRESSMPISRKRLRAGSSRATPESRKSRRACSTSARAGLGSAGKSGAAARASTAA